MELEKKVSAVVLICRQTRTNIYHCDTDCWQGHRKAQETLMDLLGIKHLCISYLGEGSKELHRCTHRERLKNVLPLQKSLCTGEVKPH